MNLFRLLALALLVWIGWHFWRNYRVKRAREQKQAAAGKRRIEGRMVKCRSCDLHLPEADALREGEDWFCSQAHRQHWLQQH